MPLQHMQKDLKLSLSMGDQLEQPLPVSAAANEVYKHAKRLGYADHDVSAVYIRARFWAYKKHKSEEEDEIIRVKRKKHPGAPHNKKHTHT